MSKFVDVQAVAATNPEHFTAPPAAELERLAPGDRIQLTLVSGYLVAVQVTARTGTVLAGVVDPASSMSPGEAVRFELRHVLAIAPRLQGLT